MTGRGDTQEDTHDSQPEFPAQVRPPENNITTAHDDPSNDKPHHQQNTNQTKGPKPKGPAHARPPERNTVDPKARMLEQFTGDQANTGGRDGLQRTRHHTIRTLEKLEGTTQTKRKKKSRTNQHIHRMLVLIAVNIITIQARAHTQTREVRPEQNMSEAAASANTQENYDPTAPGTTTSTASPSQPTYLRQETKPVPTGKAGPESYVPTWAPGGAKNAPSASLRQASWVATPPKVPQPPSHGSQPPTPDTLTRTDSHTQDTTTTGSETMLGILKQRLAEERATQNHQQKEEIISRQNKVISQQREVISGQEEVIEELAGVIRAEIHRSFHQHHPSATGLDQHGPPSTPQTLPNTQQSDYSAEQKRIMEIGNEGKDPPPPPPLGEDPAGMRRQSRL